ncbi:unnamed protein product [Adineta steineri]|uniref:Methyltransferase FkbM domain-containing protein n=1 Tax=Adineta steineri TaxID=433720 RepID=A0A815LFG4_9BILA|nr:unnamed protein product [Adineta steineri]
MISRKQAMFIPLGITCIFILLYLNFDLIYPQGISNIFISTSPIIYGNFTCETAEKISNLNVSKYHKCLSWSIEDDFWPVEGLHHIAHKGLLNSSSLIVEVGGNRGHDTVKFIEHYDPWIISYEPLVLRAKSLTEQFKSNSKVKIHPYGLGSYARKFLIDSNDYNNVGTNFFQKLSSKNSSQTVRVELLDIVKVIQDIRRTRTKNGIIDMLSLNCKGCEFEILPALILNNMTQYFRTIQFSTHLGLILDASVTCIYCQIEVALDKTHETLYHYTKIWEGWVLKNKTEN